MKEKGKRTLQNFVVLTADVRDIESQKDETGRESTQAMATIDMGVGKPALPLHVIAQNGCSAKLAPGRFTLLGRLGCREEQLHGVNSIEILLLPSRIEALPADGRMQNYACLTLRLGQDAESRTTSDGRLWARVNAALSQGRNDDDSYRPSLWLTLKAFTNREGNANVPQALGALHKGDLVTVIGRFAYEIYHDRPQLNLIVFRVEPLPAVFADQPQSHQAVVVA